MSDDVMKQLKHGIDTNSTILNSVLPLIQSIMPMVQGLQTVTMKLDLRLGELEKNIDIIKTNTSGSLIGDHQQSSGTEISSTKDEVKSSLKSLENLLKNSDVRMDMLSKKMETVEKSNLLLADKFSRFLILNLHGGQNLQKKLQNLTESTDTQTNDIIDVIKDNVENLTDGQTCEIQESIKENMETLLTIKEKTENLTKSNEEISKKIDSTQTIIKDLNTVSTTTQSSGQPSAAMGSSQDLNTVSTTAQSSGQPSAATGSSPRQTYKTRHDFVTDRDYVKYVRCYIKIGMRVKKNGDGSWIKSGDIGTVIQYDDCVLVDWQRYGGEMSMGWHTLELLE